MKASELAWRGGEIAKEAIESYRSSVTKAANVEGFTNALDLNAFSLEGPSKILQPFSSKYRNEIPRVPMSPASDITRWKVIKNARPMGKVTVSTLDGSRGPNVQKDSDDVIATLKRIALGDFVVDDAQWFSKDYDNIQATADLIVLQLLMEAEDRLDIGGNITALAAPTSPVATITAATGSLSAAHTHDFKITALTTEGLAAARLSGYTGAGDGESVPSAATGATAATALNDRVTVVWNDVPNAAGFDVYDQVDGVGGYLYCGTVEQNLFILKNDPSGTGSAAPGADTSADPDAYDGTLQLLNAASVPFVSMDGAPLTSTGTKNINQFLDMFEAIYRATQTGPEEIWVGPGVARQIPEMIGGSSAPAVQVFMDAGGQEIVGGFKVNRVLNPFTDENVQIKSHPRWPAGLIFFLRKRPPYDHARINGSSIDKLVLREYWRETFSKTSYKVEFGVSAMHVLRVRSALGSGILKNVYNGYTGT